MSIYASPALYIESCDGIVAKIEAIDMIIASLLTAAAENAGKSGIDEYQIDTGQSKIRTKYRSMSDIFSAINDFRKLKIQYENMITGRVFSLKDRNSIG